MVTQSPSHTAHQEPHLRRGLLYGWVTSIWFHAAVLVVAAFGLRGCTGPGNRGEADGDWRAVGLVTRTAESSSESQESDSANPEPLDSRLPTPDSADLPPAELMSKEDPPVPLPGLPGEDLPPVIGPGSGVPSFATASASEGSVTTGGVTAVPQAPSGLSRGETGWFGIRDKGETFVYVIDTSGSMTNENAIAVAKAELVTSLASLHSGQQFQVIFYNERPTPLRLPGKAPQKLYDATDINRTLARQFIAAVQADLGTRHMPALNAALELQPDVIFFLTDADDPALTAKDLDDIRRRNTGGTRIHAVEFGQGAKLDSSSALERLAQQNHGAYQYRDVTRIGRR